MLRAGAEDVIFSHDFGGLGYTLMHTKTIGGGGAWNEIHASGAIEGTWPRAAYSGMTNTIHMINLDYSGGAGTNYLQYWRSQDGGATFDIQQAGLPGLDTAGGYSFMQADAYAMAAQDSLVAIVAGAGVTLSLIHI